MLHQSFVGNAQHLVRRVERDPEQAPATGGRYLAVADEEAPQLRRAKHPAENVVSDVGRVEVDEIVTVEVFGVQDPVAVGALHVEITPGENLDCVGDRPLTQCRIEAKALSHDKDRIRPVAQNAHVVGLGVEDAVDSPLGVEPAYTHVLGSGVRRVDPGDGQAVGGQGEGVFVYRTQIKDELEAGIFGTGKPRVGEHPEFEKLVVRQVDAGVAEGDDQRPEAGRVPLRARPQRRIVRPHDTAGRVGVKCQVEHRLLTLAGTGDHYAGIDVPREHLRHYTATYNEILPRHLDRVGRVEGHPEPRQR